jgi:hypothetical protein
VTGDTGGKADYPDWGCRGTLIVTRESAWSIQFEESLKHPQGKQDVCFSGTLILRKEMDALDYRSPGFNEMTGTLRKAG